MVTNGENVNGYTSDKCKNVNDFCVFKKQKYWVPSSEVLADIFTLLNCRRVGAAEQGWEVQG